jgi:hypothetical protein
LSSNGIPHFLIFFSFPLRAIPAVVVVPSPAKKQTKKFVFFIFFRVVAPSSSLSRTLTADLAFPSLSLRVLGNLDFFFFFFYRKPAYSSFHGIFTAVV